MFDALSTFRSVQLHQSRGMALQIKTTQKRPSTNCIEWGDDHMVRILPG